jgi:translation initiation factor eIF-2B subunit gamma
MPKFLGSMLDCSERPLVHVDARVSARTVIGSDSMLGESSTVDDKCSIKKSVIGTHCTIGERVSVCEGERGERETIHTHTHTHTQCKITNSVIMDHVTIKAGSVISVRCVAWFS